MSTIEERIAAAKDNAVLQAKIWAQEARTQRATVLDILRYFGLPERDYEALSLIRQRIENIAAEWDDSYVDAPGGVIDVGPALRRSFVMDAYGVQGGDDASEA